VDVNYLDRWYPVHNKAYFFPHRLVFFVSVGLLVDGASEKINIITGYSTTQNCSGIFDYTAYTLEAAIGEYEFTVTNGSVSPLALDTPRIVAISNNTGVDENHFNHSTLAGIVELVQERYISAVLVGTVNNYPSLGSFSSASAPLILIREESEPPCRSYHDPAPTVLQDMNSLMFRVGVYAAQTLNLSVLQRA
jgi:hypothetical protein